MSPQRKLFLRVPMAQTEHLPIYKSSYDLCLYLEGIETHWCSGRPPSTPFSRSDCSWRYGQS